MLSSILLNPEPIRRTPSPFDLNSPHVTRKQIEKAVGFRIRNIKWLICFIVLLLLVIKGG